MAPTVVVFAVPASPSIAENQLPDVREEVMQYKRQEWWIVGCSFFRIEVGSVFLLECGEDGWQVSVEFALVVLERPGILHTCANRLQLRPAFGHVVLPTLFKATSLAQEISGGDKATSETDAPICADT
jgi:hypothetical protein